MRIIADTQPSAIDSGLPEPYYDQDGITIYHGDCREILPLLDPVDLVLTDPPYGIASIWQGGFSSKHGWGKAKTEAGFRNTWDAQTVDDDTIRECIGKAKHAVIWGGNYYPLPPSRCWFLWDKKVNDQWTTAQAEMAWTNVDRPVRVFRLAQGEAHAKMGYKQHPTQKPLSLMQWCIRMIPGEVHTILDPFMGSGTTLRAAKDLGRRAIGIEMEERYCEIAVRRLSQQVLPLEVS